MSAIWGCVDLSGTFVDPDIPDKMSECTKKYRIDQSQSVLFENVYMACGLQYITKESQYERLPIVQDDIFFTADVLLDNREELIKETSKILGIKRSSKNSNEYFQMILDKLIAQKKIIVGSNGSCTLNND